jgi:hypothetical protein
VPDDANATSQWKQLRQTVPQQQKGTDADALRAKTRIGHLCAEDKQKVGKLIRQVIKVGAENEKLLKELTESRTKNHEFENDQRGIIRCRARTTTKTIVLKQRHKKN